MNIGLVNNVNMDKIKALYQRIPKPAAVAVPIIVILVVVLLPFTVPTSRQITIEGVIEIHTRPYFSQVSGRIVEMPISLGQRLEVGDTIAVFENVVLQNQIDNLEHSLEQARLSIAQLRSGSGVAGQIAAHDVEIFQRQMFNAQEVFLRTDELYQAALNRGDSRDVLEPLILDRDVQRRLFEISEWQYRSAQQGVVRVVGGGLQEQISSIEADINFLERQLAQAHADEAKNTITATQPGIVVIRNFEVGGLVSAGAIVAEISNDNDRQAVFWVPEEFLDQIYFGAVLPVSNRPQNRNEATQTFEAPINFIDFSAQFTPREAASATNQNRLSFQVKLELPNEANWRVAQRVLLTLTRE